MRSTDASQQNAPPSEVKFHPPLTDVEVTAAYAAFKVKYHSVTLGLGHAARAVGGTSAHEMIMMVCCWELEAKASNSGSQVGDTAKNAPTKASCLFVTVSYTNTFAQISCHPAAFWLWRAPHIVKWESYRSEP